METSRLELDVDNHCKPEWHITRTQIYIFLGQIYLLQLPG